MVKIMPVKRGNSYQNISLSEEKKMVAKIKTVYVVETHSCWGIRRKKSLLYNFTMQSPNFTLFLHNYAKTEWITKKLNYTLWNQWRQVKSLCHETVFILINLIT